MSGLEPARQWGPQPPSRTPARWWQVVVLLVLMTLPLWQSVALLVLAVVIRWAAQLARDRRASGQCERRARWTVDQALERVSHRPPAVFLGVGARDSWCHGRPDRAVLLLGPPRSGKSAGVVIPSVLGWTGPVVSTSTKSDVLSATRGGRSRRGTTWEFDPSGAAPSGSRQLRWSPVGCAGTWDGAMMIARAMVNGAGVGRGTTDGSHWSKRAIALLAPLLHAAALERLEMRRVVGWVMEHELDEPGSALERHGAELAQMALAGLQRTEDRELSSIFSAAADALEAYTSEGALAAAADPNFDANAFVLSHDAVYVHAGAEHQALAAPLVCGLLADIRRATYAAHAAGRLSHRVLFALDEAANIAPLAELPQIASEGGGQGLTLLACFQDLSQARSRWGEQADGFLTLFGEKLILPGVAEPKTLEAISMALGEFDRQVQSRTRAVGATWLGQSGGPSGNTRTTSTQRQRVLPPGDIANIPDGHGLHVDGLRWELVSMVRSFETEPWRTLTGLTADPTATRPAGGER